MKHLLYFLLGCLLPGSLLAQGPISLPVYQSGTYASDTLYDFFGDLGPNGLGTISLTDSLLDDTPVTGMRLVMVVDSVTNPGAFAWDSAGTSVLANPGDTLPLPVGFSLAAGSEVGFSVVHAGRPSVSGEPYPCRLQIAFTLGDDFGMALFPEFPLAICYVDSFPYAPLLTEAKSWEVYQWENGGIVPQRSGDRMFLGPDTLVHGQTWSQLHFLQIQQANPNQPFVAPFQLGNNSLRSDLLIREDLATRQVWTLDLNQQLEYLTYDFSLQPGDTFFVPYVEDTLVLDSIRSYLLQNGETRQQFFFTGRRPDLGERTWIEGIGGRDGLGFPFSYNFEFGSWLECVRTGEEFLFSGPNLGCQLMVSQEAPLPPTSWSVYPQPAKEQIRLRHVPLQAQRLDLLDLQGRLIRRYALSIPYDRIGLPDLSTGLYLLRLDDGSCQRLLISP